MSPDAESARGLLAPESVRALLATDFWSRVEGGGETGSTNEDAWDLIAAGAAEGTVVLSTAQRAGRGRFGRTWSSPRGGVYLSVLLHPSVSAAALSTLPLVIGLGVAHGIEGLGVAPTLKWPNDVLLEGGKLAGVLVESRPGSSAAGWAVAGIGVNVSRASVSQDLAATIGAAFLGDALPKLTLAECAAAVLDGIAHDYRRFTTDGFESLVQEYRLRSATLGREVTAFDRTGALLAEGRAVDIDSAGRLLVLTPEGKIPIASGEVSLKRHYE